MLTIWESVSGGDTSAFRPPTIPSRPPEPFQTPGSGTFNLLGRHCQVCGNRPDASLAHLVLLVPPLCQNRNPFDCLVQDHLRS
jgi:hypothetical protein